MKFILFIFSIFLFLGCTTTKPMITDYKIHIQKLKDFTKSKTCKNKSLKISKAFSSSSMMSLKMNYVEDNSQVFSYNKSQWIQSPTSLISEEVFLHMRDSNIFKSVNIYKSHSKSDLKLEIIIEDFMQYYTNNFKKSYVNIELSMNLIDTKTYTIISSQKFKSKINTKTLDAIGGVKAFNIALNDILTQNVEWIDGVCK